MKKYNRSIDETRLEQAKERSMNAVMKRIHTSKQESFLTIFLQSLKRLSPIIVGVFVVAAIILSTGNDVTPNPPTDQTVELSEQETETLATLSYLSGSLLYTTTTTLIDSNVMLLSDLDEFAFEQNIEEINTYFDTLRVFLDDDDFSDQVSVTQLNDSAFDILLEMNMNNQVFAFYVTMNDDAETFIGEITVADMIMDVEGSIEEEENEISFELSATNKNNSIYIEYESEIDSDEIEKEFRIETTINGVTKEKEVFVSKEQDEAKVEFYEIDKEFELTKEVEDGVTEYKLEYDVNGVSGEARIRETVDADGNLAYSYHISEEGREKDIEVGRPEFAGRDDDDDDDDEEDYPGNSNNRNRQDDEDDEEEDDEDNEEETQSNQGVDESFIQTI